MVYTQPFVVYSTGMEKRQCTKCRKRKKLDEFSWKNKAKGWRSSWCKSCVNEARMNIYKGNKTKHRRYQNERRVGIQQKARDYLSSHPCVDCGEDDVVVLDFDHVRGKKVDDVNRLIWRGFSWENVKKEIEKCEVRCANCHRRATHRRRGE